MSSSEISAVALKGQEDLSRFLKKTLPNLTLGRSPRLQVSGQQRRIFKNDFGVVTWVQYYCSSCCVAIKVLCSFKRCFHYLFRDLWGKTVRARRETYRRARQYSKL